MEKWEYLTRFFEAKATKKEIKDFIKAEFDVKRPKRFAPEAMIPELNKLGEGGWEMIHMEPVAGVGGKQDVLFDNGRWSNYYFCVFKRRIRGTGAPVISINYGQWPDEPVPQPPPQQPAQQYAQTQQPQAQQPPPQQPAQPADPGTSPAGT